MILRVVADHEHAAAGDDAGFLKQFEKRPEGLSVESSGLTPEYKLTVSQADGGEVADALSCRVMLDDGILGFRRDPHAATRPLLLEMHFVQRPQIHRAVFH